MPWLPKKLQNVMAVTDCVALFWQPNPISVGRANPECRGDGHEKEFVPCRPDLACDRLVCVRRWRRSLDPLYLSAASTSTWSWMLWPIHGELPIQLLSDQHGRETFFGCW